jgi:type I restriction enzyme S subunit
MIKKLNEISEIIMGQSPRSSFYNREGVGLPFLQGCTTFGRLYPAYDTWTSDYNKVALSGDILFTVRAPVGDVNLCKTKTAIGRGLASIRATSVLPKYLFYLLQSNKDAFVSSSSGTIYQSINKDKLGDIHLNIHSASEQQHIVDAIGSVDRLLELNQKKIKCFSSIIKSEFGKLYSSIPARNSTIGENFECVLGGTPKTECSEYWDGDINWINSGALNSPMIMKATRKITQNGLDRSAAKIMKSGTTVVAITGATLGKTSLLAIDAAGNQSVVGILESDNFKRDFIFPLLLVEMPALSTRKTGGAQLHINKQDFLNLPIKIPTQSSYQTYSKNVMPLFLLQANLAWENEKLEALREILLLRYF